MNKGYENSDSILIKSASGMGNISKTLTESNIGLVQAG